MTERALGARLQALEPGSARYQVVAAAQKFKASWVELAQHLSQVRASKAFASWGYASFAAYCGDELCIKQETAAKLTRSYGYLQERAPAVLEASSEARKELPPLDVVDLLRQAKSRTTVSAAAWNDLEGEVLAQAGGSSRSALRKRLEEVDPQTFAASTAAPRQKLDAEVPSVPVDAHNLRKVLLLAERLDTLLRGMGTGIDAQLCGHAEQLVQALRQQVDSARGAAARNAAGSAHLPPATPMH